MKTITPEAAYIAFKECGGYRPGARELDMPITSFRSLVEKFKTTQESARGITDAQVKSKARDLETLLRDKCDTFQRYDEYEESVKLVERKVLVDGPIGILHFGDPHLDSDGTDMASIIDHVELVKRTEGMFAGNVGDTTNNWVGRLARLRAEESITAEESWVLAEWFVKSLPWLYIIGGNHDLWSGDGDPIKFFSKENGVHYEGSRIRIGLNFKNGRQLRLNMRHDFAGYSQWNAVHGATKAALLHAQDHIYACGHKHTSYYGGAIKTARGHLAHCLQIATYKIHDSYKTTKGFRDQNISPCAVTLIDPYATDERNFVTVYWEPHHAADILGFMRRRWKKGKAA